MLKQEWFEQYWPDPNRESDKLYVWYRERDLKPAVKLKAGDRVLVYEVGRHRIKGWTGAKKLFASGILTDKIFPITPQERSDHGDEWKSKRLIDVKYRVEPIHGLPLDSVLKILGYKKKPRRRFRLNSEKFDSLEAALRQIWQALQPPQSQS